MPTQVFQNVARAHVRASWRGPRGSSGHRGQVVIVSASSSLPRGRVLSCSCGPPSLTWNATNSTARTARTGGVQDERWRRESDMRGDSRGQDCACAVSDLTGSAARLQQAGPKPTLRRPGTCAPPTDGRCDAQLQAMGTWHSWGPGSPAVPGAGQGHAAGRPREFPFCLQSGPPPF